MSVLSGDLPEGVDELFPCECPLCGAEMRSIGFFTAPPTLRGILAYLADSGERTPRLRIAPARGPPLWDLPDAGTGSFDPGRHRSTNSINASLW